MRPWAMPRCLGARGCPSAPALSGLAKGCLYSSRGVWDVPGPTQGTLSPPVCGGGYGARGEWQPLAGVSWQEGHGLGTSSDRKTCHKAQVVGLVCRPCGLSSPADAVGCLPLLGVLETLKMLLLGPCPRAEEQPGSSGRWGVSSPGIAVVELHQCWGYQSSSENPKASGVWWPPRLPRVAVCLW